MIRGFVCAHARARACLHRPLFRVKTPSSNNRDRKSRRRSPAHPALVLEEPGVALAAHAAVGSFGAGGEGGGVAPGAGLRGGALEEPEADALAVVAPVPLRREGQHRPPGAHAPRGAPEALRPCDRRRLTSAAGIDPPPSAGAATKKRASRRGGADKHCGRGSTSPQRLARAAAAVLALPSGHSRRSSRRLTRGGAGLAAPPGAAIWRYAAPPGGSRLATAELGV